MKINIRYTIILGMIFQLVNTSCQKKKQPDEFERGRTVFEKVEKDALKYLSSKKIDIKKAREVDVNHCAWVKDTVNNDTIDSYSTEWGYLEAFDDIKHNKLALVMMGPPPDPIYWKLIYKYDIGVKLNVYERQDSGALAYENIMTAKIEEKYGDTFFEMISSKSDSIYKLIRDTSIFAKGNRSGDLWNIDLDKLIKNDTLYLNNDDTELFVEFPGGNDNFEKYIQSKLRYPDSSKRAKTEGKVFVGFSINTDGSICDVKILRGISPDIDKEAIRLISSMPKWKWGKDFKSRKKVTKTYPISFKLEDKKTK